MGYVCVCMFGRTSTSSSWFRFFSFSKGILLLIFFFSFSVYYYTHTSYCRYWPSALPRHVGSWDYWQSTFSRFSSELLCWADNTVNRQRWPASVMFDVTRKTFKNNKWPVSTGRNLFGLTDDAFFFSFMMTSFPLFNTNRNTHKSFHGSPSSSSTVWWWVIHFLMARTEDGWDPHLGHLGVRKKERKQTNEEKEFDVYLLVGVSGWRRRDFAGLDATHRFNVVGREDSHATV